MTDFILGNSTERDPGDMPLKSICRFSDKLLPAGVINQQTVYSSTVKPV